MDIPARDAAWVKAEIPLPPERLLQFLDDVERLWRCNPYLHVEAWHPEDAETWLVALHNESNNCRVECAVKRETLAGGGYRFRYASGFKLATEFWVESRGAGSELTVIDHYAPTSGPDDPRLRETDHSLVPWIAAVRRYIVARARWGVVPGWRWWNERFMPGLPPRQRRIVRMIVWLSVIEFVVVIALVAILRMSD